MGWAAADLPVIQEAQVACGLSRREIYKLGQLAQKVQHVEKGPRLKKLVDELYAKVDEIHAELDK